MKEGIYLGPTQGRMRSVVRTLLVLALAGLVLQALWYVRERARLGELRSAIADSDAAPTPLEAAGNDDSEVLQELRAATLVGAVDAIPPTVALSFVETVLPEGIAVTRLDLDLTRPASLLTIAAVAKRASDVSALQRNVEGSPLAVSTELLEERRTVDGELAIRLQVELSERTSP